MTQNDKISDLLRTDDLPEEIKNNLLEGKSKKIGKKEKLIVVFKTIERPITLDEMIIVYFRLHGDIFTRDRMQHLMYYLKKSNIIKAIGNSRPRAYGLTDKYKN